MRSYSLLLGVVCLLLFFAFAWFGHYDSDDFYLYKVFTNEGIWQYQWRSYLNWDGRSISLPVFIQSFFLKEFSPRINILAWLLLFAASVYLVLYNIITTNIKGNLIKTMGLPFFVIWLFVFWIGNYTNLADTVYWCTGGVYTIRLFFILLWLSLFKMMQNKKFILPFMGTVLFTLLTFLVAQSSVQIGIAMLVFLAITLIGIKHGKVLLFFLIVTVLIGISVTALTPGNLNRATVSPSGLDIGILAIFKNTLKIYTKFFIYGALLFAVVCYFSIRLFGCSINVFFKNQFRKRTLIEFLFDFKYALMALATVLPIIVLPDFAGHRPSIYFMWFMAMHLMIHGQKKGAEKIKMSNTWQLGTLSIFLIFLLVQFALNYRFHSEILKREQYLYNQISENDIPEIAPINISIIPFTYKHNDVINNVFAEHYGHEKVLYNAKKPKPEYFRTYMNRKFQVVKASLKSKDKWPDN